MKRQIKERAEVDEGKRKKERVRLQKKKRKKINLQKLFFNCKISQKKFQNALNNLLFFLCIFKKKYLFINVCLVDYYLIIKVITFTNDVMTEKKFPKQFTKKFCYKFINLFIFVCIQQLNRKFF